MAITMHVADVTLHDLSTTFGLQLTEEAAFFTEWHADVPALSKQEKPLLSARPKVFWYNISPYLSIRSITPHSLYKKSQSLISEGPEL